MTSNSATEMKRETIVAIPKPNPIRRKNNNLWEMKTIVAVPISTVQIATL